MSFDENKTINGLYGFVYDENGAEMSGTQEFDAKVELDKVPIKQAGKFMEGNKVVGGKGKGSIKFLKLNSKLQKKLLDNPTAKFNYMGKLADPTVDGEEAALFTGVSFDAIPIMGYKLGEIVEVDLEFTFDDCKYTKTIE